MAKGIGVDIIAISRMEDVLSTSGGAFERRIFTAYEQQRADAHPDRTAYLAMVFAAKEAIFKTFGIGWESGVKFQEIDVRGEESEQPVPVLSGRFAELMNERNATSIFLSLSCDGDYAVAIATLV